MFEPDIHKQLSQLLPFPWQERQWQQLLQQKDTSQLAHAYLIQGSQGLGKRLLIEKFAYSLLCLKNVSGAACGECTVCKMAVSGSLPDLLTIHPEEGSRDIKIDQIRQLSQFISKSSHAGSGKVVIVDRAHCLNNAAENALLKTLEEPSESTFIFLITDLPGALSATIRSRCQRLNFSINDLEKAKSWLLSNLPQTENVALMAETFANGPLQAFSVGNASRLEHRAAITNYLSQLLQSPAELRGAISSASKIGELASIGYLIDVSTILIKDLLIDDHQSDASLDLASLTQQLMNTGLSRQELSMRLMGFQQELIEARRQLMSGSNPNPQLIMESLLWHWTKLAA